MEVVSRVVPQPKALELLAGNEEAAVLWTDLAVARVGDKWEVSNPISPGPDFHKAVVVWKNETTIVLLVNREYIDGVQHQRISNLVAYDLQPY